jgi:hypothetical protein
MATLCRNTAHSKHACYYPNLQRNEPAMLLTQPVCQRLGLLALISRKHKLVEMETALRAAGTPWSYFTGFTGTFLVQNKSTNTDGNGGTFFPPPPQKKSGARGLYYGCCGSRRSTPPLDASRSQEDAGKSVAELLPRHTSCRDMPPAERDIPSSSRCLIPGLLPRKP